MPPRDDRPVDVRFWELVEQTETCWLWCGPRNGVRGRQLIFNVSHRPTRVRVQPRRWLFERAVRVLEEQEILYATCGEELCVRPEHMRPGTTGDAERYTADARASAFWARVDRSAERDGCWPWTGGRLRSGYGRFPIGNTTVGAHRQAWELTHGPIPEGLFVCHRCDNPPCVRPDHLFLGTPAQNSADMSSKGRTIRWPQGAPAGRLTDDQVRAIRQQYRAGGEMARELATVHGVSAQVIRKVALRRTYQHVVEVAAPA